jgi:DNA ligase-1
MQAFAQLCEAIASTTKKLEKTALVADFLRSKPVDDAALAAVFLSGRTFPAYEETVLNVGGALLSRTLLKVSKQHESELGKAYRRHGDLGSAAFDLFVAHEREGAELSLKAVEEIFRQLSTTGKARQKEEVLLALLKRASALEAKYLVKIMSGDLRIGLRESLVEEAIAKAFDEPYSLVKRANMLLGDVGETVRMAAGHNFEEARMRLFHPIGMMLASPAADTAEALEYIPRPLVEDKYDGIRAQVHHENGKVKIFSRTLDEITDSFPELAASLQRLREPAILDGEIVAWDATHSRALPFSDLQQRLGRKNVSVETMKAIPVAYLAFDVLYARGDLQLDSALTDRAALVDEIIAGIAATDEFFAPVALDQPQTLLFAPQTPEADQVPLSAIVRSPVHPASGVEDLDRLFDEAQARGNEGLMVKDPGSPYLPGRRGKYWLKIKRELATLDVVVTAVEYGHGKRAKVLSDYTFAVRSGDELLNIGKAYSGLTDAEIAELTPWFKDNTISDQGHRLLVEPKVVLEVAFNNMMESDRHESGLALRFPRILRIRTDKSVDEVDTLERAREIYESQKRPS